MMDPHTYLGYIRYLLYLYGLIQIFYIIHWYAFSILKTYFGVYVTYLRIAHISLSQMSSRPFGCQNKVTLNAILKKKYTECE